MNPVFILTTRNLRMFFRDKAGVFFSVLSALILIGLYALFLGNLQVENLTEKLPNASATDIRWFVYSWVFAGITMITTLTTSLASLSIFVDDKAQERFKDFLVSPVKRSHLIYGYLLSSYIVSVIMSLFIVLISQVFLATQGNTVLTAERTLQVVGYVVLSSAAYAALSSFIVTFLKTSGAFAALSTVVGTIIGFLAGAYIPAGTLPASVVHVLNTFPFAQSAMLLRRPFTSQALEAVTTGPNSAATSESVSMFYGITSHVGNFEITIPFAVTYLLVVLTVFAGLGTWRISKGIR